MKASSQRQLNVRSDEACALADALARRQGLTRQEIVLRALRAYATSRQDLLNGLTPRQEASRDHLVQLGQRFRSKWKYGEGSDHSDMYDEFGLPV